MQTELRAVKTRRNNSEERISDMEDRIIEIPEGVEKDKAMENIFEEIIAGNSTNLKDTEFKVQCSKQVEPK